MDNRRNNSDFEDLGWGWSRRNVIACTVLAFAVLALLIWQWSGRRHHLGAKVVVEQELVEQARARLDPNTASAAELMSLPGVGPGLADKIVGYREGYRAANGPESVVFAKLKDLQKVKGIGPKIAEKLRPYLKFVDKSQ